MNKLTFAVLGAAALSMTAACNKSPSDNLAENVQDNYDNAADNVDAMAANTSNDAESDALKNQADQLKKAGDNKADAVDEKMDNGMSGNKAKAEVNAM